MSLLSALPVIGKVLDKGLDVVDQFVEDKDQAARLKAQIKERAMDMDHKEIQALVKAQAGIVKAEVQGESWLQRNWRPLLMLCVIAIIFNNYVLVPYLSLFTDKVAILELPNGLWALLNVGVGGYVAGRSGEKIMDRIRKGKPGNES
jgi:hypothetical protein